MKHKFIILGAGGHGSVVADVLLLCDNIVIGYADNNKGLNNKTLDNFKILGTDEFIINNFAPKSILLANGIGSVGNVAVRRKVYQNFSKYGYQFQSLQHPSAIISSKAKNGIGVQIMAGAIVQPGVYVGENTIINTGAIVDHECVVGNHGHIGPGATLSGNVCVGDSTHIGTGACIIQGIKIGSDVLIGAGTVVTKNIPDGSQVVGVPARNVGI